MFKRILTLLTISILLLTISCQKDAAKTTTDDTTLTSLELTPNVSASIAATQANKGLGAVLHTDEEYDKLPKADVQAIREAMFTFKGVKNAATAAATAAATLPSTYALDGSVIGDQGQEGSCVAWATAYAAASALEHIFKGTAYPTALRSPEYVYNQIKVTSSCASGSYISSGLDLIKTQGVCSFAEMPYTDVSCSQMPNSTQIAAASAHKFTSWATVKKNDVNAVKQLLSVNLPVIIGITVDQSFYNMGATSTATWSSHSGRVYGGHAIAIVGYDDVKQAFKVQNSWGTGWGQGGYFWITYTFFAKSKNGAASEAYVAYVQ